jgi:hypothetical protein
METNPIPRSKNYFRCIWLNSVGTVLSVGRIFSISPPSPHKATKIYTEMHSKHYKARILNF